MGIKNLFKVIKDMSPNSIKTKSIHDYKNKILLIDAVLMIYKNVMAIRKNGYDIMNGNKNITHVHSMLNKLRKFKELNITPIFIFDGTPPELKIKTLENRERVKTIMKEKYATAKTKEEKTKYYYLKSDITNQEIEDSIELIKIFGYCVLFAKEEADQLLALLSRNEEVAGVVTDDMDILVFGGKNILKDFSVAPKKTFYEIDLARFKKDAGLNQDRLIILALLLGTDYSVNVPNIGPKKAPALVKRYKTINTMYEAGIIDKNTKNNFIESFNIFKKTYIERIPALNSVCDMKKLEIDYTALTQYLLKFNYKPKKIKELIKTLKKK